MKKQTKTKIRTLKEVNFKIKFLRTMELNELQFKRISNLIFKEVNTIEDLEKELYNYKRKIIQVLKDETQEYEEEVHKEGEKYFSALTFITKSGNKLATFHNPITGKNIQKQIDKIKRRNLKHKREIINHTTKSLSSLKQSILTEIKEESNKVKSNEFVNREQISIVKETSGVIVKNRNLSILEKGNENYKAFISAMGKLHNLILATNLA